MPLLFVSFNSKAQIIQSFKQIGNPYINRSITVMTLLGNMSLHSFIQFQGLPALLYETCFWTIVSLRIQSAE